MRIALATIACTLLAAGEARAFEHQQHIGIDGGPAFISIAGKPNVSVGGGGGIHYAYGLNDAFNLMVEGAFTPVSLEEKPGQNPDGSTIANNRPTMIENVGIGASWVLDITRWVPYFGVLATTMMLHGGTVDGVRFAGAATIAAGIDYMVTRHVAVGFAFRGHIPFTDINNYSFFPQFFLRAEYVWGW